MLFQWAQYSSEYDELIDSWLDACAVQMTGLDRGWNTYWNEVLLDSVNYPGCVDVCRVVKKDGKPIGVVSFGYFRGDVTISEIILAPECRGRGYGSAILRELRIFSEDLFHDEINSFRAVVFSANIPSQKAFEKAGFEKQCMPDGMCFAYRYLCDP